MQRTIGNRAVNWLIQAKLKIGEPGDQYEREADHVAEQVLHMPEQETMNPGRTVSDQFQCFTPKQGEDLQRQADEEEQRKRPEESKMQMKPANMVGHIQPQAM